MKIYFCDGCNESIPLTDIQAGQVTAIKGKLFCRKCIPPGTGGGPSAAPGARNRTRPWVVVALLALLGWTVAREWPAWMDAGSAERATSAAAEEEGLRMRLDALEADLDALRADRREQADRVASVRADLDIERSASSDQERLVNQLRDEVDRLGRGQAETGQLIEQVHLAENRASALEERVNALADMVSAQRQALQLLAQRADVAGEAELPETPVDATLAAELESIRRQLQDPDAGQRFDAVTRVEGGRHLVLATELISVLADEDPFVRSYAMQVLGDFGHTDAVRPLLEVLADPSAHIRKIAAETLVRLTGHDPGFDFQAPEGERGKAVERWRDWIDDRAISG